MLTKNKRLFRFDSCLTLQNSFFFFHFILFSYYIDFVSFRYMLFSYFTDFIVSFRWISFSYFTDFVSFRSISFSYFTDFVGFCFRFVSFLFVSQFTGTLYNPMHNNTNAHSSSRKDVGKYRYQLLDKHNF